MSVCLRCEVVPEGPPKEGYAYLAPPENSTAGLMLQCAKEAGLTLQSDGNGIYAGPFEERTLSVFLAACDAQMATMQLADTRVLVLEERRELAIPDILAMRSLSELAALNASAPLRAMLEEDRLTTFFHPILAANGEETPFAYECLLRGVADSGDTVPPGFIFEQARRANMLFVLDRAARLCAIRTAHEKGVRQKLFINFNPTSIYNPEFCLKTTLAAIWDAGIAHDQIVFEVVESDEVTSKDHLLNAIRYYRNAGFEVALDDLGAGYGSLNMLHSLKPDYIKLDMDLIRNVDSDPFKASISRNLLTLAKELGIRTIAEGVETVGEWEWCQEHGADYVQGFLFAKPSADPPVPQMPAPAG